MSKSSTPADDLEERALPANAHPRGIKMHGALDSDPGRDRREVSWRSAISPLDYASRRSGFAGRHPPARVGG